ncbi:hypothetical protein V5O48_010726 [Marasmius crinis-equi]|uniref:Secreted protein n=1 Tax=Marasmius crinis-equi TaxID=585013 RepID=A0ABR3F7M1_9AGAR
MHFFATATVLALSATAAFSAPTANDGSDASASFATITSFGLNGSGCPPGSASTTTKGDKSAVTAVFSQFTPSVSTQSFRQNCQASIQVTIPSGKKFTVDKVAYNGFVQLDSKVSVVHGSIVYFQAQTQQQSASDTLKGPTTKEVDLSNTFSSSGAVWSACGATSAIVNVDISVVLNASGNSDGFASVDTANFGPFKLVDCY